MENAESDIKNMMHIHDMMSEGPALSLEQKNTSKTNADLYRKAGYVVMEDDVGIMIVGKTEGVIYP